MAFSSTPSTNEPRVFSVDGLRAEIHEYSAVSGDTSGTITASRLVQIQHVVMGSGDLNQSSLPVLSGASAAITFVAPTAVAAELIVQDLTYTSDVAAQASNSISIAYTGGATAGAEVVTVVGNAISVQIETAVSTATQVKAAVDASVAASALISVAITGTGSNAQVIASAANLAGGVSGGGRGFLMLLGK